ncbi:hypothetical protein E2C01_015634 [Portunus trituberculatus]|uniref:Uncharacterized protein n=1 Tax=Portunus trituberculatus TaxID=210409 RepID=A0A5B7DNX2_PORTR|nr:hypothetical protein [Portunus trituberculatus]
MSKNEAQGGVHCTTPASPGRHLNQRGAAGVTQVTRGSPVRVISSNRLAPLARTLITAQAGEEQTEVEEEEEKEEEEEEGGEETKE